MDDKQQRQPRVWRFAFEASTRSAGDLAPAAASRGMKLLGEGAGVIRRST
jgi:hypothetical protein